MVILSSTPSDQDRRLRLKNQDQLLMVRAMEGAGLSRWEAGVLPELVKQFKGGDVASGSHVYGVLVSVYAFAQFFDEAIGNAFLYQ